MKLIVGLGNIGREYENTRHNIGFMVVDELAKRLGVSFGKEDRNAYCAEYRAPEKILIIKPTTYMNLSGIAVGAYANFYHIDPEDIAVIQDDMDLPVGHLRIRRKGSAGGHNGIKSITEHLGTEEYPRFKIGIGHPERNNRAVVNHVLHQFQGEDKAAIEAAVKSMVEALEAWLKDGDLNAVMTKYNTKKAKKEKPPRNKPAEQSEQTEQGTVPTAHDGESKPAAEDPIAKTGANAPTSKPEAIAPTSTAATAGTEQDPTAQSPSLLERAVHWLNQK